MSVSSATTSRPQSSADLGPQAWLENLGRDQIQSGALARLIADQQIEGAIANTALSLAELQQACDLFGAAPGARLAGYVSVALPLHLANDTSASIAAARSLWTAIGRQNAMIAIPATAPGIAALEQAVFEGISVNATLIFNSRQLAAARAAHRRGLARRLEARLSVQRIASFASIPTGRIDAAVDALLPPSASALRGKAALSLARVAWQSCIDDSGFAIFAAFGATPQRLLRDGAQDTAAATDLAGAGTVNTMTGEAPAGKIEEAQAVLAQLGRHGIELDTIGNDLQRAGLTQFERAHADLLALLA